MVFLFKKTKISEPSVSLWLRKVFYHKKSPKNRALFISRLDEISRFSFCNRLLRHVWHLLPGRNSESLLVAEPALPQYLYF